MNSSQAVAVVVGRAKLDALLLQQFEELRGLREREKALRHVWLLRELRDLAEHREVLVGYLERRRDDEEEEVHWLLIDRLEVHPTCLTSEGDAELVHHERPAVRNGDAS